MGSNPIRRTPRVCDDPSLRTRPAGAAAVGARPWRICDRTPARRAEIDDPHLARPEPLPVAAASRAVSAVQRPGAHRRDGVRPPPRVVPRGRHRQSDAQRRVEAPHLPDGGVRAPHPRVRRIDGGGPAEPGERAHPPRRRRDQFVLDALAVPVPPGRARAEALAADRARRLAAHARRPPPAAPGARSRRVRWLSRPQLGDGARAPIRVPALLLLQRVRRHPAHLHRRARLDVHWTQPSARVISIARRADVAFLDTFIGPKS